MMVMVVVVVVLVVVVMVMMMKTMMTYTKKITNSFVNILCQHLGKILTRKNNGNENFAP